MGKIDDIPSETLNFFNEAMSHPIALARFYLEMATGTDG